MREVNNIDCRNINIKDTQHQEFLVSMCRQFIDESCTASEQANQYEIYDSNILLYEGHHQPIGFDNEPLQQFVRSNWNRLQQASPRLRKDEETGFIYVVDNKIPKWIDGIIANFTEVRKTISVRKDDDYHNDNIEKVIEKMFEKDEQDNQVWSRVIVPAIEMACKFGLSWIKDIVNYQRNIEYGGKIETSAISPYEVLFDPKAVSKYLEDTCYRIHRKTLPIEVAAAELEKFGIKREDLVPEEDKRLQHFRRFRYNKDDLSSSQYCNLYYVEYKKLYSDVFTKQNTYRSLGITDEIKQLEQRDYYFYCLYIECLKQKPRVVFHTINKNTFAKQEYDKFYLTPLINKKSDLRFFPLSHIEELRNTQDLINIFESLLLANARGKNKQHHLILDRIYDKYGKDEMGSDGKLRKSLLQDWWEKGGFFPVALDDIQDMRSIMLSIETPDMPREMYEFLNLMKQNFEDRSESTNALQGDYPRYNMSGKAIDSLNYEKRKRTNYFDININYTNTQCAMKKYNFWANDLTSEMFLKTQNVETNSQKAILINSLMSFPEYEQHLIDIGLVDEQTKIMLKSLNPNDPMYFAKKMQLLKPFNDKYSETNEVEFVRPIVSSNIDSAYNSGIVSINMLSAKDKIDVKVMLDFNSERDERETKLEAINGLGVYMPKSKIYDYLSSPIREKKLELMKAMQEENQFAMLSERGDEFKQALQQFIIAYDQTHQT